MSIQRISNTSLFNSTIRNVNSTQSSLFELQEQISSGVKAKNFRGLNGQVEQFVGLESQLRKLDMYKQNNAVLESRLRTTSQSMDTIIELADQLEDLIVLKRSATTEDNLNFSLQIKDKMKTIADSLNVASEGRYLFAGTRTDQKPVPDALVSPTTPGVPDAGYFVGSLEKLSHRIDEDIEIEFPAKADDLGFQKLFAAANLALSAGGNDAVLARAVDLVQDAQSGINAVQARINSTVINLEQVTNRQEQQTLYLRGVTESVAKTDIVAATTQMANEQTILQASYQVFARLVQLKLSDYL